MFLMNPSLVRTVRLSGCPETGATVAPPLRHLTRASE